MQSFALGKSFRVINVWIVIWCTKDVRMWHNRDNILTKIWPHKSTSSGLYLNCVRLFGAVVRAAPGAVQSNCVHWEVIFPGEWNMLRAGLGWDSTSGAAGPGYPECDKHRCVLSPSVLFFPHLKYLFNVGNKLHSSPVSCNNSSSSSRWIIVIL